MPRAYSSRRSAITFSIISTSSTCGLVRWALAALDALLWALALPLCKRGHQRALAWQPANPEALGVDTRLGRLLVHAAGAAVGAREARVREDATQHQSALPRREFCLLLLASYFLLLTPCSLIPYLYRRELPAPRRPDLHLTLLGARCQLSIPSTSGLLSFAFSSASFSLCSPSGVAIETRHRRRVREQHSNLAPLE